MGDPVKPGRTSTSKGLPNLTEFVVLPVLAPENFRGDTPFDPRGEYTNISGEWASTTSSDREDFWSDGGIGPLYVYTDQPFQYIFVHGIAPLTSPHHYNSIKLTHYAWLSASTWIKCLAGSRPLERSRRLLCMTLRFITKCTLPWVWTVTGKLLHSSTIIGWLCQVTECTSNVVRSYNRLHAFGGAGVSAGV